MTRLVCLPPLPPEVHDGASHLRNMALASVAGDGESLLVLPDLSHEQSVGTRVAGGVPAGTEDRPSLAMVQDLAIQCRCIVVASLPVITGDRSRPSCRLLVINADGTILAYQDLPANTGTSECRTPDGEPGAIIAKTPVGLIGLCSCHGLASALHCRLTAQAGAEFLVIAMTGRQGRSAEQRSILIRARAIETCAYVIAPGGAGVDSGDDAGPYQAMSVDPWGRVLGDRSDVIAVTLDRETVRRTRTRLPVLAHDRPYWLDHDTDGNIGQGNGGQPFQTVRCMAANSGMPC